ncbi:hypothetical protein CEXT_720371 [Caerostris extrusa]|uniref:Uncharacterized protein n=1 Tax=Caerostris extrusa TaxID=172846 RepID=A0AAV4SJH1_CAEEX|nr:hypothetical protein CEXT_720371 [Caerostris extrusa]
MYSIPGSNEKENRIASLDKKKPSCSHSSLLTGSKKECFHRKMQFQHGNDKMLDTSERPRIKLGVAIEWIVSESHVVEHFHVSKWERISRSLEKHGKL